MNGNRPIEHGGNPRQCDAEILPIPHSLCQALLERSNPDWIARAMTNKAAHGIIPGCAHAQGVNAARRASSGAPTCEDANQETT